MAKGPKLTDRQVRTLPPGVYGDGFGLWLRVGPTGSRTWVYRYKLDRKAHQMGLGSVIDISLGEARDLARAARKLVKQGTDPIEARRKERAAAKAAEGRPFHAVAAEYIEEHRRSWSNPKHAAQWTSTLTTYAFPVIGDRPVNEIGLPDILAVLRPIWTTKTETASRVRGRIEAVLDYAAVHDLRQGDNPARWAGWLDQVLPEKSKIAPVQHHAALPWREAPAFWQALVRLEGMAPLCLRFIMLTAARSNEGRGAAWDEVDLDLALWTVPPQRMKTRRQHVVPLSQPALALIEHVRPLARDMGSPLFPGLRLGRPLTDAALGKVFDRLGRPDLTTHGFRSTFRDWVGEATTFAPELAEASLAHAIGNKVTQAYARGSMLDRRREVMEAWGSYLAGGTLPEKPAAADETRLEGSTP